MAFFVRLRHGNVSDQHCDTLMTNYVTLPFNKKLNLLREHCFDDGDWPDLDHEKWCPHCGQSFTGHAARVWQDEAGERLVFGDGKKASRRQISRRCRCRSRNYYVEWIRMRPSPDHRTAPLLHITNRYT